MHLYCIGVICKLAYIYTFIDGKKEVSDREDKEG